VTRNLPEADLVDGLQDLGDFGHPRHHAIRTTGLLTLALAGLSPAEHTSFTGRNNVACGFPAPRSSAVDSQHRECLHLPVRETQLRSQQSPKTLDEDVVSPRPFPSMLMAMPFS